MIKVKELNAMIKSVSIDEDRLTGNGRTMLGLLAHCIELHDSEYGLMFNSASMMRYVNKCVDNALKSKSVNIIGYTQLIKYVNSWARASKLK